MFFRFWSSFTILSTFLQILWAFSWIFVMKSGYFTEHTTWTKRNRKSSIYGSLIAYTAFTKLLWFDWRTLLMFFLLYVSYIWWRAVEITLQIDVLITLWWWPQHLPFLGNDKASSSRTGCSFNFSHFLISCSKIQKVSGICKRRKPALYGRRRELCPLKIGVYLYNKFTPVQSRSKLLESSLNSNMP